MEFIQANFFYKMISRIKPPFRLLSVKKWLAEIPYHFENQCQQLLEKIQDEFG